MAKTIAILAPSPAPFQLGGAEKAWWGLREALARQGALAEIIKLPSREGNFAEIIDSYERFSKLDLSHFDFLITSKYPAWIASHPRHICYMFHPLRGLYDTYKYIGEPETVASIPAALGPLLNLIRKPHPGRADLAQAFDLAKSALADKSLPASLFMFPGPLIREIVHFFDRVALGKEQIMAYLALSNTVAKRKDYFPEGSNPRALYLPSDLKNFRCREREYFFTASRLNSSKRVRLLIDAMKYVKGDVQLKIAGQGQDAECLIRLAAHDKRIVFLGYITDSALEDLYAGAIAVPFVPMDEDYGLITVEAMKSGKPVITTTDSGGAAELVRHGETGLVVAPAAPDIGNALNRLAANRGEAEKMGRAAREFASAITWDNCARELLAIMDGAG